MADDIIRPVRRPLEWVIPDDVRVKVDSSDWGVIHYEDVIKWGDLNADLRVRVQGGTPSRCRETDQSEG